MSKWLEQALHRSRYPNGLYTYEKELNSVVFDSLRSNDPVDVIWTGSSYEVSHRQEYWSDWPCPLPGDLPYPGIELSDPEINPVSSALQADSLPSGLLGKHKKCLILGNLRILTDADVFIFHFVFYLCLSSSLKYKPLKRRSACMRYENSFDYSYFCER